MPTMITKLLALSLLTLTVAACSEGEVSPAPEDEAGDVYHVYYLGGQSNMDGYGFTAELPEGLTQAHDDVMIFHGNIAQDGKAGGGTGLWAPLAPGHGTGFLTDGVANQASDRFGPELTFGHRLSNLKPEQKIALIKYSLGGTGLIDGVSGFGSWDPNYTAGNRRNQYDNALTTIHLAMDETDIDGDGRKDKLIPSGIIWMQGEADAYDSETASREYDQNLARLMELLRAALHTDDLPVVIGQIKDSGTDEETRVMKYSPEVIAAQARFVSNDPCASLVDVTEDFEFIDGWHYLSDNYVELGQAFAEAVVDLEGACPPAE